MRLTVFILMILLAFPSYAANLTLQECKDYGDSLIRKFSSQRFQDKQGSYRLIHGRYWQGVSPVEKTPSDGVSIVTNRDIKPMDGGISWKEFGESIDPLVPVKIEVHEYVSDKGSGYVIISSFEYANNLWVKQKNFGPETRRTHDWKISKSPEPVLSSSVLSDSPRPSNR